MATKKKKMIGGQIRADSDAQASWGKVRAPKVSDEGNALSERSRLKSAKAASQKTVSTRARYATAVSKANKNARKEISDWENNTKKTGFKMKNKAGAASYWGGKTKAPIHYIGGNKVDVGENARGKTMHGLGQNEVRFRGVEKERRNAVKSAKIGSVGGKNKARTVQWVSDFPVTFVDGARGRSYMLANGYVDSYKKREKKKRK